jgi:hypothetical protein
MTLLITAATALLVTLLRFLRPKFGARWRLGVLALILWGASLMWLVDLVAVSLSGEAFIDLSDRAATVDDALLGGSVLVLAVFAWFMVRLVRGRKAEAVA